MSSERYNGRPPPQTRVIPPAGTALHRISGTGSPYTPNSFNSSGIRALGGDPLQGRFEPIDDSHGGYLYVALSLAGGAVAEGILRDIPIPRSGSCAGHGSRARRTPGWSSAGTSPLPPCWTATCDR